MELQVEAFSQSLLSAVQGFECGADLSAAFAAQWIKSPLPFPGALKSMEEHGNSVWLYFLDVVAIEERHLVGFGSLGVTRWAIDPPDGPRRDVGFIPMLAVASQFQGKPTIKGQRRYSHFIVEDLIGKARERGFRELCLFAHKENGRAIRLYGAYGFQPVGVPDVRGNLRMLKLLD